MANKIRKDDTLTLVNNGIFPVKYDEFGVPFTLPLDTKLNISGTLQGEGKLVGTPSLFIRTSGCNLRCAWKTEGGLADICDTPFSSWNPEKNEMSLRSIFNTIRYNLDNIKHVVVTGGEPVLQFKNLTTLLKEFKEQLNIHITLETNGTLFNEELFKYVDLISVSPKLSSSTPWKRNLEDSSYEFYEPRALRHEMNRKSYIILQRLIDMCYNKKENGHPDYTKRKHDKDFQFKFVVSDKKDLDEIKVEFDGKLKGLNSSDIYIMPMGSNREILSKTINLSLEDVIKYGWRYTPRLHVDLFNDKRDV